MLENLYEGLNVKNVYEGLKVYLSKEYFFKMYPTCVFSKLCKFIKSFASLFQYWNAEKHIHYTTYFS